MRVHDNKVSIDPDVLLIDRTSIIKTFEDELKKFFEYELAPFPLSFFDVIAMF